MNTPEILDLALFKEVAAGTVPEYTSLILRLDPSYMQPRCKLDQGTNKIPFSRIWQVSVSCLSRISILLIVTPNGIKTVILRVIPILLCDIMPSVTMLNAIMLWCLQDKGL